MVRFRIVGVLVGERVAADEAVGGGGKDVLEVLEGGFLGRNVVAARTSGERGQVGFFTREFVRNYFFENL